MIILGIDPGSRRTGYAALEVRRPGETPRLRALGVWTLVTARTPSLGSRLEVLHGSVGEFFRQWNPALIGFEKAVTFKNPASALTLAEARGVIRLAAHEILDGADKRFIELSPTAVKKNAAGFGLSTKGGIQRAVSLRFAGIEEFFGADKVAPPADAFDALAIAWTAWVHMGRVKRIERFASP